MRQAEVNRNRRSSREHSGPITKHGTWVERRNPLDSAPSFASLSLHEWRQIEGNEVRASTSEGRQEMEHREQSWLGASENEARPSERVSGRKAEGGAASWRVGSEEEGRESGRVSKKETKSMSRRESEGEKSHREQSWLRTSVSGGRASERESENVSKRGSEGEKSHRKQSWLRGSDEAWASEDEVRVSECVSRKGSVLEKDHQDQGWLRISQDEGGPQAGPVAERVSKNPERLGTGLGEPLRTATGQRMIEQVSAGTLAQSRFAAGGMSEVRKRCWWAGVVRIRTAEGGGSRTEMGSDMQVEKMRTSIDMLWTQGGAD